MYRAVQELLDAPPALLHAHHGVRGVDDIKEVLGGRITGKDWAIGKRCRMCVLCIGSNLGSFRCSW